MTRGQRHLLIACDEASLTGITILDEQHRCFAAIINSFHYSIHVLRDPALLPPTVAMVMNHFKIHCATELAMMKVSNYPKILEHQAMHDHLIAEATYYLRCLKEEDHGLDPEAFLHFLKNCWQKHILHEDKDYSVHMLDFVHSQHRVIKKGH